VCFAPRARHNNGGLTPLARRARQSLGARRDSVSALGPRRTIRARAGVYRGPQALRNEGGLSPFSSGPPPRRGFLPKRRETHPCEA
jgi:hypothetical protein